VHQPLSITMPVATTPEGFPPPPNVTTDESIPAKLFEFCPGSQPMPVDSEWKAKRIRIFR
jgi:hypothetical protein